MNKKLIYFIALLPSLFGAEPTSSQNPEDIIVLGSGVGSMTAAIYLARAGVLPLVIEGPSPGGLITQSHSVQNWPGEMEISGTALADKMKAQALENGAKFLSEEVIAVDFSSHPFSITTQGIGESKPQKRLAKSVIIALGSKPNFLAIPGEKTYWGRGISNCAVCDGSLYRGKKVAIAGGGDAAVLEALYLSTIAKEVALFVRKGAFRGIEEKRIKLLKAKANVQIHFHTEVMEVKGTADKITSLLIKTKGNPAREFEVDGLFLAIGSKPNTSLFKGALELDAQGYIVLKKGQETSVAGVYAMGDVVDPIFKQAITAAGDGAKAALQAERDFAK